MKKSELITKLHPLIKEPGLHDMMLLLVMQIEDWKTELVDAKGDVVSELQGAIKRTVKLILELKRDPIGKDSKGVGYNGEV